MNVPIPTFTTFAYQSGRFCYSFTLDHWTVKYVRRLTFSTKQEAEENARNCKKAFSILAGRINKGQMSPIHIPSKHESFVGKFDNITKSVDDMAAF